MGSGAGQLDVCHTSVELCGQRYREPYVQVLEPLAAAAVQREKEASGGVINQSAFAPMCRISKGELSALL